MAFSSRAAWIIAGIISLGTAAYVVNRVYGSVDPSLAGVWQGYGPMPEGELTDPLLARNIAAVQLTLEPGGKFRVVDGGLPFAGQWRRNGEIVTLDVETFMERPLSTQTEKVRQSVEGFAPVKVAAQGRELEFRSLSGNLVALKRQPPEKN